MYIFACIYCQYLVDIDNTVVDLLISLGEPDERHVNKWCIVLYDGVPYPGVIVDVDNIDWGIEVKVMHRIGRNRFFWPTIEDRCWYTESNFVTLINEPHSIGSRHVQVDAAVWACIEKKLNL